MAISDPEDEIVKAAQGIVLGDAEDGGSQTEDDFKPHSNKRNATSLGRRKIDIEFIEVSSTHCAGPNLNVLISTRIKLVGFLMQP
jgi:hypothetical protein